MLGAETVLEASALPGLTVRTLSCREGPAALVAESGPAAAESGFPSAESGLVSPESRSVTSAESRTGSCVFGPSAIVLTSSAVSGPAAAEILSVRESAFGASLTVAVEGPAGSVRWFLSGSPVVSVFCCPVLCAVLSLPGLRPPDAWSHVDSYLKFLLKLRAKVCQSEIISYFYNIIF